MYTSKETYEFIAQQTSDAIIERRTCSWTGEEFPIFQNDKIMLEKISPVIGGKKYFLPLPTLSPKARQQLRYMFINYYHLYRNTCQLTGRSTISRFAPESNLKVYTNEARASDAWEYTDYGLPYGESDVLSNILRLIKNTPYQDLIGSFSNLAHNAEYTNYTADVVNSYFLFDSNMTENSCYCTKSHNAKLVFDCLNIVDSQECYECVDVKGLYNCMYCYDCSESNHCAYLVDCHGCNFCLFCSNLYHKQYHIFNKPVDKETYEQIYTLLVKNNYKPDPLWQEVIKNTIGRNCHILNTDQGIGENIRFSSDIFCSTNVVNSQNLRYCDALESSQDCLDVDSYGHESFLMYNSTQVGRYSSQIYCSSIIGKGENLLYCMETKKSKNCFGCVNLKGKEYCIFNKQYTKEEYETIVPKLIQQMQKDGQRGEFFPSSFSLLPYNDSVANDYYPVKNLLINGEMKLINPDGEGIVEILSPHDFISDAWLDLGKIRLKIKRRIGIKEVSIPSKLVTYDFDTYSSIGDISDSILSKVIVCEVSGRPFRIVKSELDFYRKHHLPLPRKHPDIRHQERLQQRPSGDLSLRNCNKCGKKMLSVYALNHPGKVYCENCYDKEIYG